MANAEDFAVGEIVFFGRIYYAKGELPVCSIGQGVVQRYATSRGEPIAVLEPPAGVGGGTIYMSPDQIWPTREEAKSLLVLKVEQTTKRLADEIRSMTENLAKL